MAYCWNSKPSALKEWEKLDNTVKIEFKKKLEKVLEHPKLRLTVSPDCRIATKLSLERWVID